MFNLNNELYLKIKEITKKLFKVEKDVGDTVGLNRSETKVISYLLDNEKLTHTQIVTLCETDKSAVSRVLNKMEKKGLIQSNYSENNKKTLYANLTQTGKQIAENLKTAYDKCVNELFGKLSKKAKEAIKKISV